jgi:hypothetical protein
MQGISAIQPIFAIILLEKTREFSALQPNSLSGEQGINLRRAGNQISLAGNLANPQNA